MAQKLLFEDGVEYLDKNGNKQSMKGVGFAMAQDQPTLRRTADSNQTSGPERLQDSAPENETPRNPQVEQTVRRLAAEREKKMQGMTEEEQRQYLINELMKYPE